MSYSMTNDNNGDNAISMTKPIGQLDQESQTRQTL